MPYKFGYLKLKIPKKAGFDRRYKLTNDDKRTIQGMYNMGWAIRKIARKFKNKVCRRTIQFVLFPERAEWVIKNSNAKRIVTKEKHAQYTREHRRYKQKLMLKNQLI